MLLSALVLDNIMDPQSARALRCAAKHPLGHVTTELMKNYIEGHRSKSKLDTTIEEPEHRCIYPVTRGRCRKRVTDVALPQYCAKHQRRSCFATPGDDMLTHWNHHGLFQKEKMERICALSSERGLHLTDILRLAETLKHCAVIVLSPAAAAAAALHYTVVTWW